MRLRALVALGLASLGLAFLIPATSAQAAGAPHAYPVKIPCSSLSVSTENPAPGEAITVTGTNFKPKASVHLVLRKTLKGKTYADFGFFTADSSGNFTASVTMPASIINGGSFNIYAISGTVSATGCAADPHTSLDIQAAAASSSAVTGSSGGGGTANTGLDIAALLALAAVLVGGGVLINRRGRKATRV